MDSLRRHKFIFCFKNSEYRTFFLVFIRPHLEASLSERKLNGWERQSNRYKGGKKNPDVTGACAAEEVGNEEDL